MSFQALWEANTEPLIAFLEEAGKAQRGIVLDQVAQILVGETINDFRMADLLPRLWLSLRARTKTY